MASVLVILAPGAEEIEYITVPDLLVRAGHQVVTASTTPVTMVAGSRGIPLAAHTRYDDISDLVFDLVYLPGGNGSAETCRDDRRVQELAEDQLATGRRLAVICASAIALVPRGLCAGRRITSYPGVRSRVEPHCGTWLDQRVVVDGHLITSQGAGTALELGLTLIGLLGSGDDAERIAREVLAPPAALAGQP